MDETDEGRRAVPPQDDVSFGEWLHGELVRWCGVDNDPWAVELVRDITDRLNAVRAPAAPLEPVILYMGELSAFIGPGRYFYVSRGLLHRAWWKEATAFVIAHEMAHHDLGHTRLLDQRLGWIQRVPGSIVLVVFTAAAERLLNGPEHEAEADARALNLCTAAGYDPARCIEAFDVLERYALDHGDIDVVFGPEHLSDGTNPGRWLIAGQRWLWQRARGYPTLRERKAALLSRLRTPGEHREHPVAA
jgi:predicted Zn-dependent protease